MDIFLHAKLKTMSPNEDKMKEADTNSSVVMVVPPCPGGVAFTREDFLSPHFTVDAFLSRWASSVSLERLRDDLGMYLQVLRVAMIELINDDYADFVNLSSNLVGLDSSLQKLEEPLKSYASRLQDMKATLENTLKALNGKLAEREALHAKRIALRNLEHIVNTLNKVERLLGLHEGGVEVTELSGDLIERVAADVNYLNFCVAKCESQGFVDEIRPRLTIIGDRLHAAMESQLLDAILNNDRDVLKRCLRIYATVDRIADAENLVRKRIIAPYLEDIVTEHSYHSDPQGLKGICQKIIKIVPSKLNLLLQLTSSAGNKEHHHHHNHHHGHVLSDFDFLVHALWPEVVERFEDNLSSLFSAGNPDRFHSHYKVSMGLVQDLESKMNNVDRFRSCQPYILFVGRWNLPVYYQIRFQEIATPVELAVGSSNLFEPSQQQQENNTTFRLAATHSVVMAIKKCWDHEIFLRPLVHRFWKLCLQTISRYCTAVQEAAKEISNKSPMMMVKSDQKLKTSVSTVGLTKLSVPSSSSKGASLKSHNRSASDQGLPKAASMANIAEEPNATNNSDEMMMTEEDLHKCLILLYLDVNELSTYLPNILNDLVWPTLSDLGDDEKQLFVDSLEESCSQLRQQLPHLSAVITGHVANKSMSYLKQVSDIPRLYRRTNREVPSKPCTYLTALISPIQTFHQSNRVNCQTDILHSWLLEIFTTVTEKYLSNVSEVLAAVQKMEESLRRLKRVRDKTSSSSTASLSSSISLAADKTESNKSVSDDDKIRIQLLVDVQLFLGLMQELGIDKEKVGDPAKQPAAVQLEQLVVDATKTCYDDYLVKSGNN